VRGVGPCLPLIGHRGTLIGRSPETVNCLTRAGLRVVVFVVTSRVDCNRL